MGESIVAILIFAIGVGIQYGLYESASDQLRTFFKEQNRFLAVDRYAKFNRRVIEVIQSPSTHQMLKECPPGAIEVCILYVDGTYLRREFGNVYVDNHEYKGAVDFELRFHVTEESLKRNLDIWEKQTQQT